MITKNDSCDNEKVSGTTCGSRAEGGLKKSQKTEKPRRQNKASESGEKRGQRDLALDHAEKCFEFWQDENGEIYATDLAGKNYKVRSSKFRSRLRIDYYHAHHSGLSNQALEEVMNTLEAKGMASGKVSSPCFRVATVEGSRIYLNLAHDDGSIVLADADGCHIELPDVNSRSQPKFIQTAAIRPLPMPVLATTRTPHKIQKSISFLKKYWRLDDTVIVLLLTYIAACLRSDIPLPVLCVQGEHGTGKSTLLRFIKRLIDPSACELRSQPKDERDLFIAALHSWILAYDNVSHLPGWFSDCLCMICTGAAQGGRTLYENTEETIIKVRRAILLNGITRFVQRGDLIDRLLLIELPVIAERATEEEIWQTFSEDHAEMLGEILTSVSLGFRHYEETRASYGDLPRMADFAIFAAACAFGFGFTAEEFKQAYSENHQAMAVSVLDSRLAEFILATATLNECTWEPSELLNQASAWVEKKCGPDAKRELPRVPRVLSDQLTRMAPALRRAGVEVQTGLRSHGRRKISIKKIESPN